LDSSRVGCPGGNRWIKCTLKDSGLECVRDVVLQLECVSAPVRIAREDRGAVLEEGVDNGSLVGRQLTSSLPLQHGQTSVALEGLCIGSGRLLEDVIEGSREAKRVRKGHGVEGGGASRARPVSERHGHPFGVDAASSVGPRTKGVEAAKGEATLPCWNDEQ
jgi:hypothetical protein